MLIIIHAKQLLLNWYLCCFYFFMLPLSIAKLNLSICFLQTLKFNISTLHRSFQEMFQLSFEVCMIMNSILTRGPILCWISLKWCFLIESHKGIYFKPHTSVSIHELLYCSTVYSTLEILSIWKSKAWDFSFYSCWLFWFYSELCKSEIRYWVFDVLFIFKWKNWRNALFFWQTKCYLNAEITSFERAVLGCE